MDYAMPHADDMPASRTHPFGAGDDQPARRQGAGGAATAAIAAVMNAIADAISGGAGAHLDMPATPEKIWQACQKAEQA